MRLMRKDEMSLRDSIYFEKLYNQIDKDDPKIKEFKRAARENPKDYKVYLNWALYIWCGTRLQEVIEKIKYSIELKPDRAESYVLLGNALCQQGEIKDAEKQYMKALEIDPKLIRAYISWGGCLRSNGQIDRAIERYKKAQEIDPKNPTLYFQWGICLSLYKKQYEEASKKFESTIKFAPSDYERLDLAYVELGNCLYNLGKTDEAIEKYLKAIEIYPWNGRSFDGWSNCLRDQGELEDSVEISRAFRKIREIRGKYRRKMGIHNLL